MKTIKKIIPFAGLAMPFSVLASSHGSSVPGTIGDILDKLEGIMDTMLPFLIAVAGFVFVWGVVQFVISAGDEEKRKKGKEFMIYGGIGLVVIFIFWGVVVAVVNSLGLESVTPPGPPDITP